jgi:putative endonuclease
VLNNNLIFPGSAPPAGGGSAVVNMICYVYAIYNSINSKIYIGQTRDIKLRLKIHNEKIFKGYTARYEGMWKLIYKEECDNRNLALIREKQLKSYRGREFIRSLINN